MDSNHWPCALQSAKLTPITVAESRDLHAPKKTLIFNFVFRDSITIIWPKTAKTTVMTFLILLYIVYFEVLYMFTSVMVRHQMPIIE